MRSQCNEAENILGLLKNDDQKKKKKKKNSFWDFAISSAQYFWY